MSDSEVCSSNSPVLHFPGLCSARLGAGRAAPPTADEERAAVPPNHQGSSGYHSRQGGRGSLQVLPKLREGVT